MSASTDVLLLDAGNSFLKWALCRDNELHSHSVHQYDRGRDDFGITGALNAIEVVPAAVKIASVAGDAVRQALIQATADCFGLNPEFAAVCPQSPLLTVAYRNPHLLGVDRWLAMLGACALHDNAVCVVDCGTALTLDAVTADGHHLGGAIVPGSTLMMHTLGRDTAQIGKSTQKVPESFFGDSTDSAVAAGCTLALCAAVDRFVREVATRLPSPPLLFVTGGDRERVLKFIHSDAVEVPDLVLLGMKTLFVDE